MIRLSLHIYNDVNASLYSSWDVSSIKSLRAELIADESSLALGRSRLAQKVTQIAYTCVQPAIFGYSICT